MGFIIGSLCRILINRQIEGVKQEAEAAKTEAKNNSVLGVLTESVQKELKQASIISETVKVSAQDTEKLYLQLSASDYTTLVGSNTSEITLHTFINGKDVAVKFNYTAPVAAPTGAPTPDNASADPVKVELINVGGKADLPGMKEALKMADKPLNVAVSSKNREGLRGVVNSSLKEILAEHTVTQVVGAPAAASSTLS